MATPMKNLEIALGGEPALPDWALRPADDVQPTWTPRPCGMGADDQRALRRALAASGSGVPAEWTHVEGDGCPECWRRLAADAAWAWRLTAGTAPLHARIEAYTVAIVPTPRWAAVLRREVGWTIFDEPERWTDMHTNAWKAALADAPNLPPTPFAWTEEGKPIDFSEGRGGAPWNWLFRSRSLQWEVLAASQQKVWIRFEGSLRLTSGLEEAWVADGMARRARHEERRRTREEAARRPSERWLVEYQRNVDNLRLQGADLYEAHATIAWQAGDRWARQPGDPNCYGNPDCRACSDDELCGLCKLAEAYDKTLQELLIPPVTWTNGNEDQRWVRDFEAQVFEAHGLLDSAQDPEAWPSADGV